MNLNEYDTYRRSLFNQQTETIEKYRSHEGFLQMLVNHWRGQDPLKPREASLTWNLEHTGVYVDVYFSDTDGFKSEALEAIALSLIGYSEDVRITEHAMKGTMLWTFNYPRYLIEVGLRVWYTSSEMCTLEPTGEYEPKLKLVCKE